MTHQTRSSFAAGSFHRWRFSYLSPITPNRIYATVGLFELGSFNGMLVRGDEEAACLPVYSRRTTQNGLPPFFPSLLISTQLLFSL